ncbi:MAG: hypothetical protein WAX07_07215 [Candidatus Altiarchaeia archaeon]
MLKNVYKDGCIFVNRNIVPLIGSVDIAPDKSIDDALEFIKMGLTSAEIKLFAYFSCFVLIFLSLLVSVFALIIGFGSATMYVAMTGILSSVAVMSLIKYYPKKLMAFEKMNAIGYAPRLIAYLVITLKEDPNLEKAVKFAAENGEDHMSEDLRRLLWNTWAGKHNSVDEALPLLGNQWAEHVKGLRDALYAIRSSQVEKYEHRRLDTLDRALRDLLENIKSRFNEFAQSLQLPIMFLFMFGVMIPLVMILFIPVMSMMGFSLGTPVGVGTLLLLLVVGVFILSEYILSKRPVSFSSISVPKDYPGLTTPGKVKILNNEISIYKFAVWITILFSIFSAPYFIGVEHPLVEQWGTYPLVLGLFAGAWAFFWSDTVERIKIRNMMQQAEEDCIESCFHIGNRLMSGMPPEEALARVSEMLSGPGSSKSYLGIMLDNTVKNIKYMNMDMKSAFFDPDRGSLKDVHSGLIRGLFGLFANSMERGVDAAAQTLIHSAQHFRDIRKVEENLREALSNTTSMTKISCVVIAPVLCGLSVTLTEVFIIILHKATAKMQEASVDGLTMVLMEEPALRPDVMTVMLGVYTLLLLLVLMRFTTILEYGDDEVRINYEISRAIPKAVIILTVVLAFGRVFFAGMIPSI